MNFRITLAKYIQDTLDDKIDLRKKSGDAINAMLESMGFDKLPDKSSTNTTARVSYNYLVKKPMDIVTDENVAKIMRDRDEKQHELDSLKSKTNEQMWLQELLDLKEAYLKYIESPTNANDDSSQHAKSSKNKSKAD